MSVEHIVDGERLTAAIRSMTGQGTSFDRFSLQMFTIFTLGTAMLPCEK